MTCKEFEKLVPDFLARKMDYPTMKQFIGHLDTCEECKEELTISFLVVDGLQKLEEGDAFDLQRELDKRLLETKRRLIRDDSYLKLGFWCEIIGVAALAGFLLWLLM